MNVEIDAREAMAGFEALLHRVTDLRPLFADIGGWQKFKTMDMIENTKLSPYDTPWKPWRPATARYREFKGNAAQGLLWDTGLLLNSFDFDADETGVEIGTPVEYGGEVQQDRPFMLNEGDELPPEDIAELEMITNLYLRGD